MAGRPHIGRWGVLVAALVALSLAAACTNLRTRNSPEYAMEQAGAGDPARMYYEQAAEMFNRGDYPGARALLVDLQREHPDTTLQEAIDYRIAECLFLEGRLQEAATAYRAFREEHPQDSRVADARVRLRECRALGVVGAAGRSDDGAPIVAVMVPLLTAKTVQDLPDEVARIQHAGFNTLVLRVFQGRGQPFHGPVSAPASEEGVYFRTALAPTVADLVPAVAAACRASGVRLIAWMNTRDATYGLPDTSELRARRFDAGARRFEPAVGLNLFHPAVEERLIGLFRDLARNDVDGILLHDDLFLRAEEGLSTETVEAFAERYGRPLDAERAFAGFDPEADAASQASELDESFLLLARLKCERIAELQSRLADAVREIRPGVRFGVSFLLESTTGDPNAGARLGQDPKMVGKHPFDYYAVTAYQRAVARRQGLSVDEAADEVVRVAARMGEAAGDPRRVLVKLQLVDWERSEQVDPAEVGTLLSRLADAGVGGVALFPYQPDYPFDRIRKELARLATRAPGKEQKEHALFQD